MEPKEFSVFENESNGVKERIISRERHCPIVEEFALCHKDMQIAIVRDYSILITVVLHFRRSLWSLDR